LQWVIAGFAAGFGWKSAHDFTSAEWIAKLNDRSLANQETRRVLMNSFRHDDVDSWSPSPWPWTYGDAMNIPTPQTPLAFSQLSTTQLTMLNQWVAGEFDDDWGRAAIYHDIDQVPLREQGDMLTRAALDFCLADAFHPGCEMTWPVRHSTMYSAPFRFLHAPDGWIEPGLGEILTSGNVTIPKGPLSGQIPGGISRWMAVPWQTDTASCRSGYTPKYDPYVPTFWPARVPNQVLTRQNYAIVIDPEKSAPERLAAFANRAAWIAPLGTTSYTAQINNMIHGFDHLGVVEVRPGPTDPVGRDLFPATIQVEDQHKPIKDPGGLRARPVDASRTMMSTPHEDRPDGREPIDLSIIEKARRFPHGLLRE
jgi:hypothetical protein